MSTASPVVANTSWELTRRCNRRQFLLTPDPELTSALLYCFAVCANRWQIQIHALALMMNHEHCNITDTLGTRVEFTRDLHQMMARCIKAFHRGRGLEVEGPVWDPSEQTGRLILPSREGHLDSIAYCLANPVSAGLVRHLNEWPSFVSRPGDMLGRRITVRRPTCFSEAYPKAATLRFSVPPLYADNAASFIDDTEAHLDALIRQRRSTMNAEGRRFGTREQALTLQPTDTPKTKKGTSHIRPTFRATTREATRHARQLLREWRKAYREAYERFRGGQHDVLWPPGTWKAVRYYGARARPDSDWCVARVA